MLGVGNLGLPQGRLGKSREEAYSDKGVDGGHRRDTDPGTGSSLWNRVRRLLPEINEGLLDKLPGNARTAVLSIACADQSLAENVVDGIELNLVESSKFIVVDRRRLDDIRREQHFQLSGDVGDDSAVSIGNM
ncbi:MAG: hypothetical protein LBJ24_05280, partial [Treponema sp.]|nr:hypothetical protein [Treponema sp.]